MKTGYDSIAKKYEEATKREARRFLIYPTAMRALGDFDVKGKRVLDLACGSGDYARLFDRLGAREIEGIDISKEQIKLAREKSVGFWNIEFAVGDCFNLNPSLLPEYDLISAFHLFQYAPNRASINGTLEIISKHLKDDGKFIGCMTNPITRKYEKYGVRWNIPEKLPEGSEYEVALTDFQGKQLCRFTQRSWTPETVQRFAERYFDFKWIEPTVSLEGIEIHGRAYWDDWMEDPCVMFFSATVNGRRK